MKKRKVKPKKIKLSPTILAITAIAILFLGYKLATHTNSSQSIGINQVSENESLVDDFESSQSRISQSENELALDSTDVSQTDDSIYDDESMSDENPVPTVIDTTVPKPPGFFKNIAIGWRIIFQSFLNVFN